MKPKTTKIIHWGVTGIFAMFMLFSAYLELTQDPNAQKALIDLGYPVYVNYIIGIAKLLGAIALLQWKFTTIKEWAYAGFTIDILGAGLSIWFNGDGFAMAMFAFAFLIPLFISYYFWKKMDGARSGN